MDSLEDNAINSKLYEKDIELITSRLDAEFLAALRRFLDVDSLAFRFSRSPLGDAASANTHLVVLSAAIHDGKREAYLMLDNLYRQKTAL